MKQYIPLAIFLILTCYIWIPLAAVIISVAAMGCVFIAPIAAVAGLIHWITK